VVDQEECSRYFSTASADGSLTMIACGRGLKRVESLRLPDGQPLIDRDVGVRGAWVASEGSLVLVLVLS
jgi:hypothetical protein